MNKEELRAHKYPQSDFSICAAYQNTRSWPKIPNKPELNKIISIDCEMVETREGGHELARISVINYDYEPIYETLVRPQNHIINYHTE